MAYDVKLIKVKYGIFNNPHQKHIRKHMIKWGKKGYNLQSRQEQTVGCFGALVTLGWARGTTELTFTKRDQ